MIDSMDKFYNLLSGFNSTIASVLVKTSNRVEQCVDILFAEFGELVRQFLIFEAVKLGIELFICIAIAITVLTMPITNPVFFKMTLLGFTILVLGALVNLLKIWIAPK